MTTAARVPARYDDRTDTERRLAQGRRVISEYEDELRRQYGPEQMNAGWSETEWVEAHRDGMVIQDAIRAVEALAVVLAAVTDGIMDHADHKILTDTIPALVAGLDNLGNIR